MCKVGKETYIEGAVWTKWGSTLKALITESSIDSHCFGDGHYHHLQG